MNRRVKKKLIVLAVLALILAALTVGYFDWRSSHFVGIDVRGGSDAMELPRFMFAFSGTGGKTVLQRPLGLLVDGDRVFVSDSRRQRVFVFDLEGKFVEAFGRGNLAVPLYIAKNPASGRLYVTDRRMMAIQMFTREGRYLGTFDPKLPKGLVGPHADPDVTWAPVGLGFAADGSMYVTDVIHRHRLVIFDPDGKFVKTVGTLGVVTKAADSPNLFQFPNSVKVRGNEVWVSDSNNRRIQVFDRSGMFLRIIETGGLPRGFDFLKAGSGGSGSAKIVVVDALAHDVTIIATSGRGLASFGEQGSLEGQFSYPNDVSVDGRGRMFIADTANGRVQVWGWQEDSQPISVPRTPSQWLLCLTPLLLLSLLPLLRRKRFMATSDFIDALAELGRLEEMPDRSRKWVVTQGDYEEHKHLKVADVCLEELLHAEEHSESDAQDLMTRFDIDHQTAVIIAMAKRMRVFCTEDAELRRLARFFEVDAVSAEEFLARFAAGSGEQSRS